MMIIDRILVFIGSQNIKISVFEKKAGLPNGYIKKIKNSPSVQKIEDILNAYPELSRSWLMSGKGEMIEHIISSGSNSVYNNVKSNNGNNQIINGTAADVSFGGNEKRIDEIENNHLIRTAEIEKNYNALLAAKDDMINELKNQNRQLTAQNEQLTAVLKLFHERK